MIYLENDFITGDNSIDGDGVVIDSNKYVLEYIYGQEGVAGLICNGTKYYYRRNINGDISRIYALDGTLKACYNYDAWGNHKVFDASGNVNTNPNFIGNINPFRYRGYYYDTETGLFYTPGRYYDPEVGRWINADDVAYLDPETIGGLNLYSYCLNNPISYIDPDGHAPKWWQWLLFGIGATLVVAATVVVSIATFGTGTAFASLGGAILLGAAKGAIIGAAIGSAVGIVGGAIYSGVTGADMGESILSGFLIGFGGGAIIGAAIGGAIGGASFASAGKAWSGGSKAMVSHFKNHGIKMGFKNPVKYTKAAQSIIKDGTYLAGKNAYATLLSAGKYNFVGVAQGGIKITTFGIRTFTKTVAKMLGLLL